MKRWRDPLGKWKNAWFLTINTNRSEKGMVRGLRAVWNTMVSNMNSFIRLREGGSIISVREKSRIEIGGKFKRVHMHAFLRVDAFGLAMLDYAGVKEFFDRQLRGIFPGFAGVYFNAKLVKNYNATASIEEYLEKDPVDEESE